MFTKWSYIKQDLPLEKEGVQHGLKCTNCNTELYSNYGHDYVTCKCGGLSIDGGDFVEETVSTYRRIVGKSEFGEEISRPLYLYSIKGEN